MAGNKKHRPHAQDFSEATHGRITDSSFAPNCDVNSIVKHYERSGIDPYADRIPLAQYIEASTISFEDAMRNKAELDSAFQDQPPEVRAAHADALSWIGSLVESEAAEAALTASDITPDITPEKPAPQDSTPDNSEGKVQ